jgi:multiple sugar transport system ATP-binding protein
MASLELRGVAKRFGDNAVIHGVDLDVRDGEFMVFVGPSGCGKSTLLRMIAGLESASDGEIRIDGVRVNELSAAQRGLAMVFQSYALYPHMTVYQNLAFGLQNIGTKRAEIDAKVDAAARMLHLDALLSRRPTQLSGGQRQRVAIGRAIVRNPKVFLFDEPLSNLDAELRVQMRTELTALHRRLRTTMIYVTHDQVEAMTMADRIVVLRAGRIEQVGTPLSLYNAPDNRFVAGFIGSPQMNFLRATASAGANGGPALVFESGERAPVPLGIDAATSPSLVVGIRPEHILVGERAARDAGNGAVRLETTVERVEQLGATSFSYCALKNGERLTVQSAGQAAIGPGEQLIVALPHARLHVFDAESGRSLVEHRRA